MTKLEKLKSKEASKEFIAVLFCMTFIGLIIVFYFVPPICDDLLFESMKYQNLSQAVYDALYYGNGRFWGNLLSIILSDHFFMAVLFKALILALLGVLLPLVFGATLKLTYLLTFLILFTAPGGFFAQVFSWNCGSVNYITPIVLTLVCLFILKSEKSSRFAEFLKCICIVFFGVSSQLFMEHNTLINWLLAVFILLYILFSKKYNRLLLSVLWFVSNSVGTVVMLIIPKMFKGKAPIDMSEYRKFKLNSLSELLKYATNNAVCTFIYIASFTSLIVAMGVLAYLVLKNVKTDKKSEIIIIKALKALNVICVLSSIIITVFLKSTDLLYYSSKLFWRAAFLGCAEIAVYSLTVIIFSKDKSTKIFFVVSLFFVICATAPFLVLNIIDWRTTFLAIVILLVMIIRIFEEFIKDIKLETENVFRKTAVSFLAAALISLTAIFVCTNEYYQMMTDYIEEEMKKGATVIEVFKMPTDYRHNVDMFEYKYYYKKQGDIKFKQVDYSVWKYNREKESQPQQ